MKKFPAILLTVLMVIFLAACGKENDSTKTSDAENTAEADSGEDAVDENNSLETGSESEDMEEEHSIEEHSIEEGVSNEDLSDADSKSDSTDNAAENESADAAENVKILVAYFSATNTTEGVAELIADSLSADLYEMIPEQPYTDADLDYHDDNSRSTIEMNAPAARPAISGSVENMEQYEIVFIGYPIWWGEAPRIVSTFVKSYDFAGKTVVPFCTSGGSGVGSSASNLEALTEGAEWISGTRLNGDSSHEAIAEWINGLGLDVTAQ